MRPARPPDPPGPLGPAGAAGPKGDPGAAGANGASGTGVTTKSFSGAKGLCDEGGVEVISASPTVNVCNGPEGEPGEPWTAGGTLPPGRTETGAFVLTGSRFSYITTAISFPIPLPASIPLSNAIFIAPNDPVSPDSNCENTEHGDPASWKNPEAKPGYLCVFEGFTSGVDTNGAGFEFLAPSGASSVGADPVGATLAQPTTQAEAFAEGTWAVTAPAAP
jgi:hypothetical protein